MLRQIAFAALADTIVNPDNNAAATIHAPVQESAASHLLSSVVLMSLTRLKNRLW